MGVHSLDSTQINPEDQGIVKLEEALGRKLDINNHYHGEWTSIAEDGLTWLEEWDVESGRIPLVGWGCYDSNKIISGSEDDVIRKTAQQMKAFGHEFFMRYCWEMDGSRKQGTVKGPEKFNEAWRHMYRIFQEEGATNVIWVWTANAAGFKDKRKYTNNEPPGPYFYPGDEYVDWIASDGYNWGVSKRNQGDRWRQVLEIFDEFMVFARAHPKPIMIGEYGAQEQSEDPTAKPEWMRHAHETLHGQAEDGGVPALRRLLRRGRRRVLRRGLRLPRRLADHVVGPDARGLQRGVGRPLVPPDGHRVLAAVGEPVEPQPGQPVRPEEQVRRTERVDAPAGGGEPAA